jgi:hypothetical protein
MVSSRKLLEPFSQIKPGPFISRYEDWIIFTLLLFFFWAVVGIALRKRFEQSRYLRTLITVVALILSIGTYYSIYRGWLHLNFQGFGLLGAFLIFIIIFFVVFGLIKAYGVKTFTALPFGYALLYISLWAISPNIFDTIARVFPILNGILLILFIVSIIKSIMGFFRSSRSPTSASVDLDHSRIPPPDIDKIEDGIDYEEKERKYIKHKTIKLTKKELNSIENIDCYLKKILEILQESNSLTKDQKRSITKALQEIGRTRKDFIKSLDLIKLHINRYKAGDQNKLRELRGRFHNSEDKNAKNKIQKEWLFEHKKIKILEFLKSQEEKTLTFLKAFDGFIQNSVNYLRDNNLKKAVSQIETCREYLNAMSDILKELKRHEYYLMKLSKREEKILKKEKKRK